MDPPVPEKSNNQSHPISRNPSEAALSQSTDRSQTHSRPTSLMLEKSRNPSLSSKISIIDLVNCPELDAKERAHKTYFQQREIGLISSKIRKKTLSAKKILASFSFESVRKFSNTSKLY